MLKLSIILSCMVASTLALSAQTQRIAHRSHSGNNKTFTVTTNENWGLGPEQAKRMLIDRNKLDSIKQKSVQADTARKVAIKQIAKDKAKKQSKTRG